MNNIPDIGEKENEEMLDHLYAIVVEHGMQSTLDCHQVFNFPAFVVVVIGLFLKMAKAFLSDMSKLANEWIRRDTEFQEAHGLHLREKERPRDATFLGVGKVTVYSDIYYKEGLEKKSAARKSDADYDGCLQDPERIDAVKMELSDDVSAKTEQMGATKIDSVSNESMELEDIGDARNANHAGSDADQNGKTENDRTETHEGNTPSEPRGSSYSGNGETEKSDKNKDFTQFGSIRVANEFMGLQKGARIHEDVILEGIKRAAFCSYRNAASGVNDLLYGGTVSHMTIYNGLQQIEVPEPPLPAEKKEVKNLIVMLDEQHVALQGPGRCKQFPLGMIVEDVKKTTTWRNELIGKWHFGVKTAKTADMIDDVVGYIATHYVLESLEQILVLGDAANWITKALNDAFGTLVTHGHDPYHVFKLRSSMKKAFPHHNVAKRTREALKEDDFEKFQKLCDSLFAAAEGDADKTNKVAEYKAFHEKYWDSCVVSANLEWHGCSEPMVQTVGADRCTTRPQAWKPPGLGQLMEVRLFLKNGGDFHDPNNVPRGTMAARGKEELRAWEERTLAGPLNFDLFEPVAMSYNQSCGTGARLDQLKDGGLKM